VRVWIVQEGKEALDQIVGMVVLTQREKDLRSTARLGRCGAGATDADRIAPTRSRRQEVLDADLVPPGDVEVVLVGLAESPKRWPSGGYARSRQ
jgi:hypothetical protein